MIFLAKVLTVICLKSPKLSTTPLFGINTRLICVTHLGSSYPLKKPLPYSTHPHQLSPINSERIVVSIRLAHLHLSPFKYMFHLFFCKNPLHFFILIYCYYPRNTLDHCVISSFMILPIFLPEYIYCFLSNAL